MSTPDTDRTPTETTTASSAPRVSRGHEVVASCPDYAAAQRAVDHLSDNDFPVDRLRIIGEGLRSVERVTGRLTTWRAALGGAASGAVFGAVIGWLLGLFTVTPLVSALVLGLYGLLLGAVVGGLFGAAGHAALRGRRDFSSVQGMVAERYDIVAEPDVAARASAMLAEL